MRPTRPEAYLPLEEDSIRIPWEQAEVPALGLVAIFAVLIATGVASGAIFEATFGSGHVNGVVGFASPSVSAPADNWSVFVESLGLTIGSLLLGAIGIYASVRLLGSGRESPS